MRNKPATAMITRLSLFCLLAFNLTIPLQHAAAAGGCGEKPDFSNLKGLEVNAVEDVECPGNYTVSTSEARPINPKGCFVITVTVSTNARPQDTVFVGTEPLAGEKEVNLNVSTGDTVSLSLIMGPDEGAGTVFAKVESAVLAESSCGCDCETGEPTPYQSEGPSFGMNISSGGTSDPQDAQGIIFVEQEPDGSGEHSYSRDMIQYNTGSPLVTRVLIDSSDDVVEFDPEEEQFIRQILTPDVFVDIVELTGEEGFEIRFYPADDVDGLGTLDLYELKTGAETFRVVKFFNPDSTGMDKTVMQVDTMLGVETTPDSSFDYVWDSSDDLKLLKDGKVTTTNLYEYNGREDPADLEDPEDDINWRIVTTTEEGAGSTLIAKTVRRYREFDWGYSIVKETRGDGGLTEVTQWEYYEGSTSSPSYGRVKSVKYPNGNWVFYKEYNADGEASKTVYQMGNNNFSTAWPNNSDRIVELTSSGITKQWVETEEGNAVSRRWEREELVIVAAVGNKGMKRVTEIVAVDPTETDPEADSNLVTERYYYPNHPSEGSYSWIPEDAPGKLFFVSRPDGSFEQYTYERDTETYFSESITVRRTIVESGYSPSSSPDGQNAVVRYKRVTETDSSGHTLLTERYWVDGSSEPRIAYERVTERDEFNRWTEKEVGSPGLVVTRVLGCCGVTSQTGVDGVVTTYTYNGEKQLASETRNGTTRWYEYDAMGRRTKVKIGPSEAEIVVDDRRYDILGRVEEVFVDVFEVDEEELEEVERKIEYAYTVEGGYNVTTITNPDGGIRKEYRYQDGRLYQIIGSAVAAPVRYEYGVANDQRWQRTRQLVWDGEEEEWFATSEVVTTYTDAAGRTDSVESPDPSSATPATVSTDYKYNPRGQLETVTDPDGVVTSYTTYVPGENSEHVVSIREVGSGNDTILTKQVEYYESISSPVTADVRVSETWVPGAPEDIMVSQSKVSVDGLHEWSSRYGQTATYTETDLDESGFSRVVTRTLPDETKNVTYYDLDGIMVKQEQVDTGTTVLTQQEYIYDDYGRVDEMDDLANGITAYTYYDNGQVETVTTPDPGDGVKVTTYIYTNLVDGTKKTVELPDESTREMIYTQAGQLKEESGSQTYRVEYTYDYAGRMETMTTFQDGSPGAAETEWFYNDAGLLEKKTYADSNFTEYEYTKGGRLEVRKWKRGVDTTYEYELEMEGQMRGVMTEVRYTDSTPTVTYREFDRQGRPREIEDGSGKRELDYTNGQLTLEKYTAGPLNGFKVIRDYDLFRQSSAELKDGDDVSVHLVDYVYSTTTGRLDTVEHGTHTATYDYKDDTNLLASTTYTGSALTITRDWDNLNRLESITNAPSATTPADMSFTYIYNDLNQREDMHLAGGEYWKYEYDDLGQVDNAEKRDAAHAVIPGYDFEYAFDDIGNRETAAANSETSTYATPNLVNQYTSRTVPGVTQIRGQADSAAVVTVNTESVTREGDYFFKKLTVDNSTDPVWESVTVRGVLAEAGRDDTDAVAEEEFGRWVPKTGEAFDYDDDGNLTQDGRWDYTWNGENRLIAMETRAVAYTAGAPRERLEFVYDSQGRRVQKTHLIWDEGETAFVEESRDLFLYDGWNLLAELRAVDGAAEAEMHRRYAWGMDLSGSLQGAGGVGGLVMVILADETVLYPAYDGNGNVMGLFDPDASDWAAEYEYGAFGEPLRATGPLADANPFRFSTKYTDSETELVYYGFRYYASEAGRWLNRDPIGERGGMNLYGFVGNDGVNGWDLLGLCNKSDLQSLPENIRRIMCCALKNQLEDPKMRERSGELYKEKHGDKVHHRPKDGPRVGPDAEFDSDGNFVKATTEREAPGTITTWQGWKFLQPARVTYAYHTHPDVYEDKDEPPSERDIAAGRETARRFGARELVFTKDSVYCWSKDKDQYVNLGTPDEVLGCNSFQ